MCCACSVFVFFCIFFFFKQKTAYEIYQCDWSSDVCSSDLMDPKRAPEFRWMMNAVSPIGLFKMVLVYDKPWWEKQAYVTKGRSLTDLPVRQLYYWGVEVDPKTGSQGKAVLMAYNDEESTTFWSGFRTAPLG